MKNHDSYKYACLFGGGAIRGAAHVGVIKALNELNIQSDVIVGSSVGSIIAALYSVGYTYEELSEVFLSVNFELFRDISFGFNQKFALSKGEVFLDWIKELIEKKYYGESYQKGKNEPVYFKDISKNLVIITTNLKDFTCQEFSTYETPNFEIALAIRISCCMPGLMRSMNYDNKILVDGDLLKGKPMWSLSKNLKALSERILEVRLEGTFNGTDENAIDYVNGMYSCITSSETDFVKSIYGKNDKYDYLVLNTGDVVVVDFNYPLEKRQKIIDYGYSKTMEYFKYELLVKKQRLFKIYSDVLDELRNVQGYMIRKKYNKMKIGVSGMFVNLISVKDYIDKDLLDALTLFNKLCCNNIKSGLLGTSTCADKDTIFNSLRALIDDVTLRVKNIDQYITKFSD